MWGEAGKIDRASPGRQRLSFHITRATGSFERGCTYHDLSRILQSSLGLLGAEWVGRRVWS